MFNLTNFILTIVIIGFICSLGYLALLNDRRNKANRFFFLFTIVLALWEFFIFFENWQYGGTELMQAMLRLDFFLAPYPILMISLFIFNFPYENQRINQNLALLSAPIILISSLSLSGLIIKDISFSPNGIEFRTGSLFFIYAAILIIFLITDLVDLASKFRRFRKAERNQTARVLFGFIFLVAATTCLNLFLQNKISSQWFRILNLAFPAVFVLFTFQAIVLYRLMNIKLIMRRSFVYFLLIISIVTPAAIWLYFLKMIIPNHIILASLIILALSLTIVSKLKRDYYRIANKYFFASLYDVREVIYNLDKALHSSLNSKQICRAAADILSSALHPQAIALLSYHHENKKWAALYNDRFPIQKKKEIDLDYKILTELFRKNRPLTLRTIEQKLAASPDPLPGYLKRLKAEIIVPIKTKSRLTGILLFGAKESRDAYTINDFKVLTTVSTEISTAMENIRLYETEKKFSSKLIVEINKATKKLQEQNEELRDLDAAKDEFVSIVSHQLRTPLTAIRWFTGLLLGNRRKNLNDEQLDFLEQVSVSNKRMIRLVNDLLDVSHIETGYKFKVVRKRFVLMPVIQEVLKENTPTIKTKNLKIVNLIPKNLKVNADRVKIKQVWQNLVSNAAAYTPKGKKITLAAETGKEGLVFSIKDEGIGVPKSQQSRLFEKFFRAKNASLQDPNGTGLGLYITRGIIHRHGGEIWFKSAENKGTAFFFTLPEKSDATRKYKITVK